MPFVRAEAVCFLEHPCAEAVLKLTCLQKSFSHMHVDHEVCNTDRVRMIGTTTFRPTSAASPPWHTSPCFLARVGPPSRVAGSSSMPAMLTGWSPPPSSLSSSAWLPTPATMLSSVPAAPTVNHYFAHIHRSAVLLSPPQGVSIDFTSLASRRPAALRGCSNELALEHKCPEHFMLRASNFWTCRHLHCCGLHGVRLGSHHRQVVLVPHRPRGAVWRTCALRADLQGLR